MLYAEDEMCFVEDRGSFVCFGSGVVELGSIEEVGLGRRVGLERGI